MNMVDVVEAPTAGKPEVLALTKWAETIPSRLEGVRSSVALYGEHHRTADRMNKAISAGMPVPSSFRDPEDIAKLKKLRFNAIVERRKSWPTVDHAAGKPGYEPIKELEARIARMPMPFGSFSAFFAGMREHTRSRLPHTFRFAEDLDKLYWALSVYKWQAQPNFLERYKQTVLDSPLVQRECWFGPKLNRTLLAKLERVTDLEEAETQVGSIMFTLQVSLVALWDAEYCADDLRIFTPIPLFLNLASRVRPRAGDQPITGLGRTNTRKAKIIDGPFANLIDLLWCMLRFYRDGAWPGSFPSDTDMCKDLNYRNNLTELRRGNPNLTSDMLYSIWPENLRTKTGEHIVSPVTLLAVAHFWDLFMPDRRPVPIDVFYALDWRRHLRKIKASQSPALTPTIDWPVYLNRGLDFPDVG